ncbi:MAG: tripartite tricarboxylate transporter substrate-binding protein [Burkholderiales bacterium]
MAVLVPVSPWVYAQGLPEEIRVIVPVTAGSSLDARARIIAEALGQRIKRRVIVENRTGAGGTIGSLAVAKAKPDGATLLFTNNSHVVSPHVYPGAGYDAMKDLVPIAYGYVSGMILVAHPSLQASSPAELVARVKVSASPPGYASSGAGGMPHIAMELFREMAGIDLLHIPYRGDGQALADVLSGRVPLMMSGYVVVQPHIKTGKLRALAVTGRQRTDIFPDVPTLAEAGYPDYRLEVWTGFFAPAGIRSEIVDKLNSEIAIAIATPAVQAQFAATGAQAMAASPAAFSAFVRQEWEIYRKLVTRLKLSAE